MGGLTNPIHLAFIAMIALIFLGPKRLPELAKSLGSGMREFRDSLSQEHDDQAHLPPVDAPAPEPAPTPVPAAVAAPVPVPAPVPAAAATTPRRDPDAG